eukprot:GDKK01014058.1.p1 GENE.GDKK01014058.1~~GDKK01014058.1.p1  ORF type:complete len:953 (+),score=233.20 GDKK01014058.1:142-2859(+)
MVGRKEPDVNDMCHKQAWMNFQLETAEFEQLLGNKIHRENGRLIFSPVLSSLNVHFPEERFSVKNIARLGRFNVIDDATATSMSDWLIDKLTGDTQYFQIINEKMKTKASYIEDSDIFAFPYDWRLTPLDFDFKPIKLEIENRVSKFGRKVLIVSHSMGSQYTLYFLNAYVSRKWKDKHIAGWSSSNGALGGSAKALQAVLMAVSVQSYYFPSTLLRRINDGVSSISSLSINTAGEYANMIGITIKGGSFNRYFNEKGSQMREKIDFEDMAVPAVYLSQFFPNKQNRKAVNARTTEVDLSFLLKDPGVPVFCFSSQQNTDDTTQTFTIERSTDGSINLQKDPVGRIVTQGDGTVPVWSQELCRRWESTVFAYRFDDGDSNAEHQKAFSHNNVFHTFMTTLAQAVKAPEFATFTNPLSESELRLKKGVRPPAYYKQRRELTKLSVKLMVDALAADRKQIPACGSTKMPFGTMDQPACRKVNKMYNRAQKDNMWIRHLSSTPQKETERNDVEEQKIVQTPEEQRSRLTRIIEEELQKNSEISQQHKISKADIDFLLSSSADDFSAEEQVQKIRKLQGFAVDVIMNHPDPTPVTGRMSSEQVLHDAAQAHMANLHASILPLDIDPAPKIDELLAQIKREKSSTVSLKSGENSLEGENDDIEIPKSDAEVDQAIDSFFSLLEKSQKKLPSISIASAASTVKDMIAKVHPVQIHGDFNIQHFNRPLDESFDPTACYLHKGRLLRPEYFVPLPPKKPIHTLSSFPPKLSIEEVYRDDCGVRCEYGLFNWPKRKFSDQYVAEHFFSSERIVPLSGADMHPLRKAFKEVMSDDADDEFVEKRQLASNVVDFLSAEHKASMAKSSVSKVVRMQQVEDDLPDAELSGRIENLVDDRNETRGEVEEIDLKESMLRF